MGDRVGCSCGKYAPPLSGPSLSFAAVVPVLLNLVSLPVLSPHCGLLSRKGGLVGLDAEVHRAQAESDHVGLAVGPSPSLAVGLGSVSLCHRTGSQPSLVTTLWWLLAGFLVSCSLTHQTPASLCFSCTDTDIVPLGH